MRKGFGLALLVCTISSLLGGVQAKAAMNRFIDDNDTVVMHGNTHPWARSMAQGLAPASLPLQHMIMSLQIPAKKQTVLGDFLKQQHDPASPNYHKWLTPEEFASKFAPSAEDVAAVSAWLTSHGFVVDEVARSRTWINFSGDANGVEQAFRTRMATVQVGGRSYHANATDPSLPRALADVAAGIVTLHNIPRQPKHNGVKLFASNQAVPNYTSGSGSHYLAPGDFAAIYNVSPLYSAGIDGTGQSIAIVGRTHPATANWASFRTAMGLPAKTPQVVVNGADPGDLGSGEDTEANLDVEWAGGIAKGANVIFVTSKSTNSTDGVDLSAQYIVSNNIAPIMSVSFGSCEADMGSTENTFYNNLWAQAAAQGITVVVAAGDAGAAGCSDPGAATGSGKAVNGLASTPYNIAVGGTQFNEAGGSYWNPVNGTDSTSATGYIPEIAWNESGSVSGGSGLWASGGGVSQVYGKPSWQVAPGVPQDGKRDLPDVSLSGAGHDAYLIYSNGSLGAVGGTSASAPSFAGVMALLLQKTGQRQGNANGLLYQMGNAQYGSGGAKVFHDITASNNSVPGVTGYSCAAGYDLVTGLGSVDAYALARNWGGVVTTKPDFSLGAMAPVTVSAGKTASTSVQVALSNGFNSAVSLAVSGMTSGMTAGISPASLAAPGSGSATISIAVGSNVPAGTSTLTVTATGAGVSHTQSFNLTVAPGPDFSTTVTAPQAVIQGSTGTFKISTSALGGFNAAVAFTVSGLPAGVSASFVPASIAAPGTGNATLTVTASSGAALGSRNFTVTATGGGLAHSVQVPLTITSGGLFSSSFTDTWYASPVTGSAGKWYLASSGTNPTAAPHSGPTMAMFNSNSAASGSQTRLFSGNRFILPAYARSATLSFWLYHDTGKPTYTDRVQAQVSNNGSTWSNVGAAVSRYNGSTGWTQNSVDVSNYIGQTVTVGFLGTSAAGNNLYLDDVALTVK
jgi:pseudomonalisin